MNVIRRLRCLSENYFVSGHVIADTRVLNISLYKHDNVSGQVIADTRVLNISPYKHDNVSKSIILLYA